MRSCGTISKNLDKVLEAGASNGSIYLRKFLLVDKAALVTEALPDQARTTVTSFRQLRAFLLRLETKIHDAAHPANGQRATQFAHDLRGLMPAIRETISKIDAVLKAFEELNAVADKYYGVSSQEATEAQIEAYQKIITTAFDQFNVMFQRETMLAVRVGNFVRADYSLKIREKNSMTPEQRRLMISYGRNIIDEIAKVNGANDTAIDPNGTHQDILAAKAVSLQNLKSIQQLFGGEITDILKQLRAVHQVGSSEVVFRDYLQANRDRVQDRIAKDNWQNGVDRLNFLPRFYWMNYPEFASWHLRMLHNFQLGTYRGPYQITDTADGALENLRARLCIQTLSLPVAGDFEQLCHGTVLKSLFGSVLKDEKLNASYDEMFAKYHPPRSTLSVLKAIAQSPAPTTPNSAAVAGGDICAYRDYNRRNTVYWLVRQLHDREEGEKNDEELAADSEP